jgi:uncharacterized protein (DUF302 family)
MYYINKKINVPFDQVRPLVEKALKNEGFGIVAEINFTNVLKEKLDVEFKPYLVLEACNPKFAYRSLQTEDKIGILLPCNVVIQQIDNLTTEVAFVNPISAMHSVENPEMKEIAREIYEKLSRALQSLA